MSSKSFNDLLEAVACNETVNQRLNTLAVKMNGFHEDTEDIKQRLSGFVDQKNKLVEQRYFLWNNKG